MASRWIVLLSCTGLALLLWDSGFGRLAAFNGGMEAGSAFWEHEALFGFSVIIVQMAALLLILSERWMWLGAVALGGLGVLTMPGSQPWLSAEGDLMNYGAIAQHLSACTIFTLTVVLSSMIRSGAKPSAASGRVPELSWRQMVLAPEVGSHDSLQIRNHSQRVFDRFYDNLHKIAIKG